jgi:oligoribonuclease
MKYLSLDIETTGLNSENDQILSVGIIIEDTEKKLPFEEIPKFHVAIVRERIEGDLFAINLNKNLLQTINTWKGSNEEGRDLLEKSSGMIFLKEDEIVPALFNFLFKNNILDLSLYQFDVNRQVQVIDGVVYPVLNNRTPISHLNVAGKNVATFDKLFVEKLPRWKQFFKIRQRIIDPTVLFTNWNEDDQLPNLTTCKERAGTGGEVTHDAIQDAFDIIELLRTQY